MKRLLLPLLAAIALPTALNAESHWLIIQITKGGGYNSLEKIEMASAEDCEKEGRRWENSPCLLYTSPSPRDLSTSRMPSSA